MNEEQELRNQLGYLVSIYDPEDFDYGIEDLEDGQWVPDYWIGAIDGI